MPSYIDDIYGVLTDGDSLESCDFVEVYKRIENVLRLMPKFPNDEKEIRDLYNSKHHWTVGELIVLLWNCSPTDTVRIFNGMLQVGMVDEIMDDDPTIDINGRTGQNLIHWTEFRDKPNHFRNHLDDLYFLNGIWYMFYSRDIPVIFWKKDNLFTCLGCEQTISYDWKKEYEFFRFGGEPILNQTCEHIQYAIDSVLELYVCGDMDDIPANPI